LMVYIKATERAVQDAGSEAFTRSDDSGSANLHADSEAFTRSEGFTHPKSIKSFNDSIGILLRSYTRAINKQENMTGSLFRNPTKAECLNKPGSITPSFYNTEFGTKINISLPEKEYPQLCFNYIHNNPVTANLVKHPDDWEFSSCRDYSGLRNGTLINRTRALEFGLTEK
jgi:putative transposase